MIVIDSFCLIDWPTRAMTNQNKNKGINKFDIVFDLSTKQYVNVAIQSARHL